MSLAEAGAALGLAPNSVRSRFKAGKIPGERDNSGKLWVFVDPKTPSKLRTSKPTNEVALEPADAMLRTQIEALRALLASVESDRDAWRSQAQELARRRWWHFLKAG
jgi:hypothetical protein